MIESQKYLFEILTHIWNSFCEAFVYLTNGLSYATGIISWFPSFIASALLAALAIFVIRFLLFR